MRPQIPGNNHPIPVIGCKHTGYNTVAEIRPMLGAPRGQVSVQIRLTCAECGAPFIFTTLPFNEQTAMVFRAPVLSLIAELESSAAVGGTDG